MLCDNQFKSSMQNLQNEYNKIIVTDQNLENSAEARAFAEQTGNIIAKNSGRSSIAQAHQNPEIVLTLLKWILDYCLRPNLKSARAECEG